jgi:putative membrane protein
LVNSNSWQNLFIVSICLAFSAFYELIEWWAALLIGEDADSFLGTQGYIWDTQSDMGVALLGAIFCLIVLPSSHNKQLKALKKKSF